MKETISNLVHPVLGYGLRLKEQLEKNESPDFAKAQAEIKALLYSDDARRSNEFIGEASDSSMLSRGSSGTSSRRAGQDQFLGIRYVLACWLDEIFIVDSPWDADWNERKIEEQLYGTNDRAWMFWDQAKQAEARPGADALEVMFLSLMLGFRGDLRDEYDKLQSWADATRNRISQAQGGEWKSPPNVEIKTNVPPLHGRERMQRMLMFLGGFVLLVIPVVAFLVMKQLLGS